MPFWQLFHRSRVVIALSLVGLFAPRIAIAGGDFEEYKGICDASAAVPVKVGGQDFFVVGDDEKNQLLTYRMGHSEPVSVLNLDRNQDHGEMDIEAVASVGKYHLWMGSHGRNKNGEVAPSRSVFFATVFENGKLQTVGHFYKNLVNDLVQSPAMAGLPIFNGPHTDVDYPEGFNIEGIASDERQLLIGLRGPLVGGLAVVMFVNNPLNIALKGEKADFSGFELLNLEGRGVRDMFFDSESQEYFIIAGPVEDARGFALYRWSPGSEPHKIREISGDFIPEAIFLTKNDHSGQDASANVIHLLSDDGSLSEKEKRGNKLPESKQRFRMMDVQLDGQ